MDQAIAHNDQIGQGQRIGNNIQVFKANVGAGMPGAVFIDEGFYNIGSYIGYAFQRYPLHPVKITTGYIQNGTNVQHPKQLRQCGYQRFALRPFGTAAGNAFCTSPVIVPVKMSETLFNRAFPQTVV